MNCTTRSNGGQNMLLRDGTSQETVYSSPSTVPMVRFAAISKPEYVPNMFCFRYFCGCGEVCVRLPFLCPITFRLQRLVLLSTGPQHAYWTVSVDVLQILCYRPLYPSGTIVRPPEVSLMFGHNAWCNQRHNMSCSAASGLFSSSPIGLSAFLMMVSLLDFVVP